MASTIFRGDAKAVAQIVRITPVNPEAGDVFSLTINGKSISYTAEEVDVAAVVDGLVAAWNASTLPEFAEITAAAVDSDDDDESDYLTLTADTAGVPFEVTASTSDAGGFDVDVAVIQGGIAETNEKQKITIASPVVSGGTFTLTFNAQTTGAIAYDASAATVQTALEALSNIAAGDVIVTGDAGGPWTVEFDQAYAGLNVPILTASGASLTGAATVSIQTTTEGTSGTNEVQQILFTGPNFAALVSFYLYDPISGDFYQITCTGNYDTTLLQSTFDNALSALGTGGSCTVTNTATKTFQVEFHGTWSGLNVTAFELITGAVTLSTITEGDATGDNEVQRVALLYGPSGGTFTLTFNGQTTAGIAYNASAATVLAALEALSTIGAGNVSVALVSASIWDVTFTSALAETDVAEMTGSGASLTGGSISVVTTQSSDPGQNEIQQISLSPDPSGGTFTLTIDPGGGDETTGAIAYNASASTVQTALEALASFASGDVVVTGDAGGPWVVEFKANFAATNMDTFTGDGTSLTGGGSQSLTLATTQRSLGPAHYDDPTNWTNARVPDSGDTLFFASGSQDCLYGLKQQSTFTAATSDLITVPKPLHLVDDQIVQVMSSDTLPAGLSAATNYYVIESDRDAGTLKLSASSGGAAVDITDTGTGTHTLSVVLANLHRKQNYTGKVGLPERTASNGYYEYRPTYLAIAATNIEIGSGDGSGGGRFNINTGPFQTNLKIFDSGGGTDTGLAAILWKGTHASNDVTLIEGEIGIAVLATETAVIDALVIRSGAVFLGTATIASIERTGGEILAENVTLAGSLQIRG